jgi:hypothetical protein
VLAGFGAALPQPQLAAGMREPVKDGEEIPYWMLCMSPVCPVLAQCAIDQFGVIAVDNPLKKPVTIIPVVRNTADSPGFSGKISTD